MSRCTGSSGAAYGLHLVHLRNMVTVTEMGAIVCPPLPAFYLDPRSMDDVVGFSVARVLDLIGLASVQPRRQGLFDAHTKTDTTPA